MMKRLARASVELIVLTLPGAGFVCNAAEKVEYDNQTGQAVVLWIDGVRIDTIEPGETMGVTQGDDESDVDRIQVYAGDGSLIMDKEFRWADLEGMDFKVVIRQR